MTVEEIAVARAEEQMRGLRMDEPTTHDRWQIRGTEGRLDTWRREFCLACEKRTWRGTSYCERHYRRSQRGEAVDTDDLPTWADYRRLCKGEPRFSYLSFASPRSSRGGR